MPVVRFERSALPAQPWKNGGGVTREIVCMPPGTGLGQFDWRVSIAHIAGSGPFSAFAGINRVITLLDGPGVHLHSPDGAIDHRLDTPLRPFAFPGEAPVQADLLGGAGCHDFNVMTRRDVCTAQVLVLQDGATLPECAQGLLLAVHGAWQAAAGAPLRLDTDRGLWWHGSDRRWQLTPEGKDAALLAVLIEPTCP